MTHNNEGWSLALWAQLHGLNNNSDSCPLQQVCRMKVGAWKLGDGCLGIGCSWEYSAGSPLES